MAKESKSKEKTQKAKKGKYVFAVGRRKSATAKIKFYPKGSGKVTVNGRDFSDYFVNAQQKNRVLEPLNLFDLGKNVDVEITARGGGLVGQADAVRLGIARAVLENDPDTKATLKEHELLTRDARVKERKKPGLKGARRAPQWQKR